MAITDPPGSGSSSSTGRVSTGGSYGSGLAEMREIPFCPDSTADQVASGENTCELFEGESGEVEVLHSLSNTFRALPWSALRVGDICKVYARQTVPADLLLLWSSSGPQATVDIFWYDGDNTPMLRQVAALPATMPITRLGYGLEAASSSSSPSPGGGCVGCTNPVEACRQGGRWFTSQPHPELERLTVHFVPSRPNEPWCTFGSRPLLPRNAKLVSTPWIVGLVLFIGSDTKFAQNGGWAMYHARFPSGPSGGLSSPIPSSGGNVSQPPDPDPQETAAALERQTGIRWSTRFENVDDDGNCLMTAFWMGLRTLLFHYPGLSITPGETLPPTSVQFREVALEAIFASPGYLRCLENQLQLWLELDAAVLMSSMEDFFLLPEPLQEYILQLNQSCQYNGVPADMEDLVQGYQSSLRGSRTINGRSVFVPLGHLEMETLCELFQVRLQVIKSESVGRLGPLESLDPRIIPPRDILDRNPTFRRIVRLLNVRSNHYMVHLPLPPSDF
eukprot:RCo045309